MALSIIFTPHLRLSRLLLTAAATVLGTGATLTVGPRHPFMRAHVNKHFESLHKLWIIATLNNIGFDGKPWYRITQGHKLAIAAAARGRTRAAARRR